jgi:hypothetical protein
MLSGSSGETLFAPCRTDAAEMPLRVRQPKGCLMIFYQLFSPHAAEPQATSNELAELVAERERRRAYDMRIEQVRIDDSSGRVQLRRRQVAIG